MRKQASTRNEIDVAYIHSRTFISVVLAVGGLLQTVTGAVLLNSGLSQNATATIKLMGIEISATSLGAVVLCTSAVWGYLSYLARPQYSRRTESRKVTRPDGSKEEVEWQAHTQPHREAVQRPTKTEDAA
jgi:hypothetical protein